VLFNETLAVAYRRNPGEANVAPPLLINEANYDSPQFSAGPPDFETNNTVVTYEILLGSLGLTNADWIELNSSKDFALWLTFTSNRLHTSIGNTKVQNVPEDVANSFEFVGVPEPATLALLGIGSLALLFRRRRK
ncbi:MAG: PEP-CTERM sorting domain-containing protein, partial [Planctomycetota bacterium]